MEIAAKYAPQQIEQKWYDYWMEHGFFHSVPDAREPYTIVIPPPNVTGVLHMGHMLNSGLRRGTGGVPEALRQLRKRPAMAAALPFRPGMLFAPDVVC